MFPARETLISRLSMRNTASLQQTKRAGKFSSLFPTLGNMAKQQETMFPNLPRALFP